MIAIATRFYEQTDPGRINVLKDFIKRARECAECVLIAVNDRADVSNALEVVEELCRPGVRAFPVTPWNHPTGALNSLVLEAAKLGASRILFASAEVELTPEIVRELDQEMIDEKHLNYPLVVGAVMKGHHHTPSMRQPLLYADAYMVPWNTCALWNLDLLSLTGFPLASNTPFYPDQVLAGSEELMTISLHQKLKPGVTAILKKTTSEVKWNMAGFDDERESRHKEKMERKNEKAIYQMERFRGLQRPQVIHI